MSFLSSHLVMVQLKKNSSCDGKCYLHKENIFICLAKEVSWQHKIDRMSVLPSECVSGVNLFCCCLSLMTVVNRGTFFCVTLSLFSERKSGNCQI